MFGMAIFYAALAFVGAPSTLVRCNPGLPPGVLGVTYWNSGSSTASLIELAPEPCAAAILLSMSPVELQKTEALNGSALNVEAVEGIGVETILIEAIHATHAYNGSDETNDACRAMSLLPSFLGRYLNGDGLAAARRWATIFYNSQPASIYHTHPC